MWSNGAFPGPAWFILVPIHSCFCLLLPGDLTCLRGFQTPPAGTDHGVLGVYSDFTALLDRLIQCLFSYNFHCKPKEWCIDYPRHGFNRYPKHFFNSYHLSDTVLLAASASTFCLILYDCSVCEISSHQISPSLQKL